MSAISGIKDVDCMPIFNTKHSNVKRYIYFVSFDDCCHKGDKGSFVILMNITKAINCNMIPKPFIHFSAGFSANQLTGNAIVSITEAINSLKNNLKDL